VAHDGRSDSEEEIIPEAEEVSEAQVYDGKKWEKIEEDTNNSAEEDAELPMSPVEDGNGEIFVTIPTLRDGERCATTLKSLFSKAKNPDKLFVGIVEQNDPKDTKCILKYCKLHGVDIKPRYPHHKNNFKCPYYRQIRYLAVYNLGAKGPVYARALTRRLIGDEEFCLQIDAHADFGAEWDEGLKSEWHGTENEYGIISTIPPSFADVEEGSIDVVRRMCHVNFADTGFPRFKKPTDGLAKKLNKPLLGHSWCAGFSFSKCHFEMTTPNDVFMPQVFDLEEITRYARLWTRGYDVYTPTKNYVFHNYGKNPEGHSGRDWNINNQERAVSLERASTLLMLDKGQGPVEHANLGIYGVGKRRSLEQLAEFIGIDFQQKTFSNSECGAHSWVPYDLSMSPFEHSYTDASDLNPQPEYPLRNILDAPYVQSIRDLKADENHLSAVDAVMNGEGDTTTNLNQGGRVAMEESNDVVIPFKTLLCFWMLGLYIWYKIFIPGDGKAATRRKKRVMGKDSKKMG